MALSTEVISQFAKVIKIEPEKSKERTVYGTIVTSNDVKYVQLDGSNVLTPVDYTTMAAEGDRVKASIKNHNIVVDGNLTSPAIRLEDLNTKFNDAVVLIDGVNAIIQSLVVGENGQSLMTQTDTGWVFNISPIQQSLANVSSDLGGYASYIRFGENSQGQPYIAVGENDSSFKVVITNTEVLFIDGNTTPAKLTNEELSVSRANIDSLQQGGFRWGLHGDGNYGLMWIGG